MASSHDFVNWERIGRGGFGKVYRAQPRDSQLYPLSPDSHGYVAIKVVDKRALKDSAAEMRLATEVAIHESLAHSSVVHIYDSFEDDRCVYLVMEYCERGDLWSGELAALSEPETRYVVQQVAAAVAYLHANGVLHRDLKLANIMLSRSMGIKIGDFGLATKIDDGSMEPTTMCGTPSYISPEIMARQPYGFESDVWAIGCLLVTLLTGAQPFRGVKHITDDVVSRISLPHSTSPEARSLVRALLRIDPRQRIRSQDLLAHSRAGLR
ncbi:kinase-like domain-containing protein [Coemansia spiralis]|nr:kinase-like domain-containing protein [Coemansia spiralis]